MKNNSKNLKRWLPIIIYCLIWIVAMVYLFNISNKEYAVAIVVVVFSFLFLPGLLIIYLKSNLSTSFYRVSRLDTDTLQGVDIDKLLKDAYQNFYDIHVALMNFDYDKIEALVGSDLFQTYKNQLDIMKLKGQSLECANFDVQQLYLTKYKEDENIVSFQVYISVEYDKYIITDGKRKKISNQVRFRNKRFSEEALLSFSYRKSNPDICPNCGATLTSEDNDCPYCNTNLQGMRNHLRMTKRLKIVE